MLLKTKETKLGIRESSLERRGSPRPLECGALTTGRQAAGRLGTAFKLTMLFRRQSGSKLPHSKALRANAKIVGTKRGCY
jgi:hypothetical protein